jgi:predicted RNase H-like HicB family nuclease
LEGEAVIREYVEEAKRRAHYEQIADEEPFYGEVPDLQGVWATGKTLEQCQQNLAEVIDDWILIRVARGLPIPPLGQVQIVLPRDMRVA